MSTATKSELKELKDLILAQSDQLRVQSGQLAVILAILCVRLTLLIPKK